MTDEDQEGGEVLDPNIRAELKALRDEKAKNEAEISSLRRDQAFADAGIPKEGAGALLRKAYDGELDAESIKRSANEFGLSFNKPEPEIPDEELEAQKRIAGANVGSATQPSQAAAVYTELAGLTNQAEVTDFMRRTVQEGRDPGMVSR